VREEEAREAFHWDETSTFLAVEAPLVSTPTTTPASEFEEDMALRALMVRREEVVDRNARRQGSIAGGILREERSKARSTRTANRRVRKAQLETHGPGASFSVSSFF